MKRGALKLVVFLLLGAIVNVAVAWGGAQPAAFGEWNLGKATSFPGCMDEFFPEFRPITYEQMRGDVMRWTRGAQYAGLTYGPALQQQITRVKCGLPMLTFAGEASRDLSSGTYASRGAIVCKLPGLGERILPLCPLWPGFAINTIFYAAVLWMVFAMPLVLRRRRRIKRGLCPACAYPVGTSPVCTECGAGLNRK